MYEDFKKCIFPGRPCPARQSYYGADVCRKEKICTQGVTRSILESEAFTVLKNFYVRNTPGGLASIFLEYMREIGAGEPDLVSRKSKNTYLMERTGEEYSMCEYFNRNGPWKKYVPDRPEFSIQFWQKPGRKELIIGGYIENKTNAWGEPIYYEQTFCIRDGIIRECNTEWLDGLIKRHPGLFCKIKE